MIDKSETNVFQNYSRTAKFYGKFGKLVLQPSLKSGGCNPRCSEGICITHLDKKQTQIYEERTSAVILQVVWGAYARIVLRI